jgi:hypothetical protein
MAVAAVSIITPVTPFNPNPNVQHPFSLYPQYPTITLHICVVDPDLNAVGSGTSWPVLIRIRGLYVLKRFFKNLLTKSSCSHTLQNKNL